VVSRAREEWDSRVLSAAPFPRPSRLKMLRFLKKRFKPSKDPVLPENHMVPTHTDIGGRDSDGEHRSELMRPMGLIRPWGQIPTMEGVLGSQIWTEGLGINGFPRWVPQLRLLGMRWQRK